MKRKQNEYIVCAAIWHNDGLKYVHQPKNIKNGFVIYGPRHHNCIQILCIITGNCWRKNSIQGFWTTKNMFVDRGMAALIAWKNGQIKEKKQELYSEDLY